MSRRTFGTVRKLPSGRFQASYLHPNLGERITGPTTWSFKADASAWLASEEAKIRGGATTTDPRRGKIRFDGYAEEWLATRKLRDRTREIYASQLKVHILPEFGNMALVGITPQRVRAWNARLAQESPAMAPKAYRQLKTMLGTAVEDGLLAQNPCRVRGAGKENVAERQVPSIPQVEALADAIAPRFRLAVLLAAYCGLRKSECFGLARRHFEFDGDKAVVVVERQRTEIAGKGVVFADLKTLAAYRKVTVPPRLLREIAAHLEQFVDDEPDALVFTMVRSGEIPRSTSWRRIWLTATAEAEIPDVHFHDLRHLAGTLSAIAGGTLKEIQARLGHASPDAAMVYQHVAQGRDVALANQIDRLIGGARAVQLLPDFVQLPCNIYRRKGGKTGFEGSTAVSASWPQNHL